MVDVSNIRKYLKEPIQVWSRKSNNIRVVVRNYGNPLHHQEHKLRLIIKLESSGRVDSSHDPIWDKCIAWVDCTYLGIGDISSLDNWIHNSKINDMKLLLMEVGIKGLLEKYEEVN